MGTGRPLPRPRDLVTRRPPRPRLPRPPHLVAAAALAASLAVAAVAPLPASADDRTTDRAAPAPMARAAQATPGGGGGDTPLPSNPPAAVLAEVPARSGELSDRVADRRAAEADLTAAEAHRDDLRDHLAALVVDRAEAVDRLARRRADEADRVTERADAAEVHRLRVADARAARARVGRAEDDLRESVIASYMAAGGVRTGVIGSVAVGGDASEDLLRAGVGAATTDAREADLGDRTRDLARAEQTRDRARRALDAAERAEADAVAARRDAEEQIRGIDDDAEQTRGEEVEAVAAVDRRGEDVLLAVAAEVPARLRADVVGVDFPVVALDAWIKASAGAPCRVPWWALAGISKIESRHGTYRGGQLDAQGYPSVAIIGPRLDGSGGFAAILDTDGGRLDGDAAYDRAVGPMQFIPSTWARWGRDGDGDDRRDPHSLYDAAAAAAAYLCHGRSDLGVDAQLRSAYFSYNHSQAYVAAVVAAAHGYRAALTLPR